MVSAINEIATWGNAAYSDWASEYWMLQSSILYTG